MARFSGGNGEGAPGPIGPTGPAADTGDITFSGVEIIGAGEDSGDGYGNGTIELVPDADLYNNNQYLIIDPTAPNHIHIRAGGDQDASNSELILGAEKTNVRLIDNNGTVVVSTSSNNFVTLYVNEGLENSNTLNVNEQDYLYNIIGENYLGWSVTNESEPNSTSVQLTGITINGEGTTTFSVAEEDFFVPNNAYSFRTIEGYDSDTQWTFSPNGVIYGPGEGESLKVVGISNAETGTGLVLYAENASVTVAAYTDVLVSSDDGHIFLNADGAVYIGTESTQENEVATIGDILNAVGPLETPFIVNGGTTGTQPTFTGDPLFSGSFVKVGPLVHFRIDVDFDNITNFGTGEYYLDLPFTSKYNYEFSAGCLHDISASRDYPMLGHIFAGQNRLLLQSLDAQGNSTFNVPFTRTSPITLSTADNFHISGDYIAEDSI